ncbi:MAG: hypothetical protein R3331_01075 [Sulfurospirillaceae bacterium]|nr:hypothetical protein [Sulfurospirillaceae bacterium]
MYSPGDIAELEKKYSTYMKKKIVKFSFILFSSLIIISLVFYFFWEKKSILSLMQSKINNISNISKSPEPQIKMVVSAKEEKNETNSSKHIAVAIMPKVSNSANATTVPKIRQEEKKKLSLAIPVNTTQQVENNTTLAKNETKSFHLESSSNPKVKELPSSSLILKIPEIKIKKEKKVEEKKVKESTKKAKENITMQSTNKIAQTDAPDANHSDGIKIEMKKIDAIKYLKDKFNENHSIIFALMLCKEYYQKKDFIDSLKWSIIANDIDNTNERSWIWFAKSKYRLNHKDDAIKALKAYLNTNNSDSIRSLLHDIINGELYD